MLQHFHSEIYVTYASRVAHFLCDVKVYENYFRWPKVCKIQAALEILFLELNVTVTHIENRLSSDEIRVLFRFKYYVLDQTIERVGPPFVYRTFENCTTISLLDFCEKCT
ncbi:hypothetical protein AB6A40_006497 [Gnathostoma spinigerum]|uniref:Uncharacterized protein n=1 Tax=Gnathostoma spinigerum TaxID=75299 RepID=A0ABD6EIR8_9BILA